MKNLADLVQNIRTYLSEKDYTLESVEGHCVDTMLLTLLTTIEAASIPSIKLTPQQISELEERLNKRGSNSMILIDVGDSMETQKDAARWRALIGCQRVRVLGHAFLGKDGPQHIGIELWEKYPQQKLKPEVQAACVKDLTLFVDTIVARS